MRIVFAGTPGFAVQVLDALVAAPGMELVGVVSQPDRRAGRGMRLTPSPVKVRATELGLDCITPSSLRTDAQALDWLRARRPDFLVVVAFGMLLPKPWLDSPRIAPINVHASLLPRWRGAAPIERAMLAGDERTGVSIMHMDEGLDTGPVYASRALAISAEMTGSELWDRLARMGGELLVETLPRIASGLAPQPQPEVGACYAPKVRNEERCIRWEEPAWLVDRRVRCFAPRPGARCRLEGRWLKVLAGKVVDIPDKAVPGSVLRADSSLVVACGKGGAYAIERVQPEGKKAMSVADFLRGYAVRPGQLLA
ncbi:MAG: methionyl-tRNA formyltransferase [Zetaproteobacteria bacterium]|nr:MAG: methionyl-tRNA formyltransferase [Zetaproteobacteria bacterium]